VRVTLIFSTAVTLLAMAARAAARGHGRPGHPRRERLRTLIVWPYAIAPALAAVLWLFIFHPSIGTIGQGLRSLGVPWDYRSTATRR
jgi:sn-glycerol 3-phosphate transport system permease protein